MELTENVTQLITQPEIQRQEKTRYNSKFKQLIRKTTTRTKDFHRTLGVPVINLAPPNEFLRKRSRSEPHIKVDHIHYHREDYQRKLPPWTPIKLSQKSSMPELPKDPLKTGRINFRKANIETIKLIRPREPKKRYIDTRYGSVQDLLSSGLYPVYIHKKNFGRAPKNILKTKESKSVSKTQCDEDTQKRRESAASSRYKEDDNSQWYFVSAEERETLLQGMRKKWDELMNKFQRLPFMTDTVAKINRKTELERKINQLEKDIKLVEQHQQICVYCNDEDDKK